MVERERREDRDPRRERERFCEALECGLVASDVIPRSIQIPTLAPASRAIFS